MKMIRWLLLLPTVMLQEHIILGMLRTQYIREVTYLAYVLSDVYDVDQVDMILKVRQMKPLLMISMPELHLQWVQLLL
jgi:hypothetical protein